MTDQETILEEGKEAEVFLEYLSHNDYFKRLVKQIDDEYVTELTGLAPTQTEEFKTIQIKRMALYEPIIRLQTTIQAAQKIVEEQTNEATKGGIL